MRKERRENLKESTASTLSWVTIPKRVFFSCSKNLADWNGRPEVAPVSSTITMNGLALS